MTCVKNNRYEAYNMQAGLSERFNIAHESFRHHNHPRDEGHHDC